MAESKEKPEAGPGEQLTEQLVAYLDGELRGNEVEVVEARLRVDPKARAEAAILKQTWELLDHLPKLEPSASFTEKTVEKLGPVTAPGREKVASRAIPAGNTVRMESPSLPASARNWVFPSLLAAIAVLALLGGYLCRGFAVEPAKARQRQALQDVKEAQQEEKMKDQRLLKNLKYYRNVDNLEFAQDLDSPELFGEEPMP